MSVTELNSRLYLTVPARALDQTEAVGKLLVRLADKIDIACVTLALHANGTGPGAAGDQQLQILIKDLQLMNIAVLADMSSGVLGQERKLFEKVLEKAKTMNCDGLHINADMTLYERARSVLGHDAIIGCDCGLSRHLAMQLGEAGADYVSFREMTDDLAVPHEQSTGQLIGLVEWWQQLFEVPCVAGDVADQIQIETLLHIPADFIAIGPTLWPALRDNADFVSWLGKECPAPETSRF